MEPALIELVRALDDPDRRRDPSLEVEIEVEDDMIDDMLLDPWFMRSEAEIALIDDDPDARITEIVITACDAAFDYV